MPFAHEAADDPFFREWRQREASTRRSVARARRIATSLRVLPSALPIATIVGSKGKGTAALYAAATLVEYGYRVGLVTSPPIISNRERIRINGVAISGERYRLLSALIDDLLAAAPRIPNEAGYLSPTGLYTLAAMRHFEDERVDVVVLEAGLGGVSDEVSLFNPLVVGITPVFLEHTEELGSTIEEIAADKAGVITRATRSVIHTPQPADADAIIKAVTNSVRASLQRVGDATSPTSQARGGIINTNAALGIAVGESLAEALGEDERKERRITVRLPGRQSTLVDASGRSWFVDAAISAEGARAALRACEETLGSPRSVLVCVPSRKDRLGVLAVLKHLSPTEVRVEQPHLSFDDRLPDAATAIASVEDGPVLAIGTWSFVSEVWGRFGYDLENLFSESSEVGAPLIAPRVSAVT